MSLGLTALRLAGVEALKSHPTIARGCAGRVYDSRLGDFRHKEPVPVILLTTDELEGDAPAKNNGGAPWLDSCNLVLEIAMTAVTADDNGQSSIWTPVLDSEFEATLDMLAFAAEQALTVLNTAQSRLLRHGVTRRVPRRTGSRFTTDETGEKFAIRLVTFRVELMGDDRLDASNLPTGPFASLPNPLRTVAESLSPDSAGHGICAMIAAALPPRVPGRPWQTTLTTAADQAAGT